MYIYIYIYIYIYTIYIYIIYIYIYILLICVFAPNGQITLNVGSEGPAHAFSCEFGEIFKNTFFVRTPPVAASVQHYRI